MPLQAKSSNGALLVFGSGPNVNKLMNECCCISCAVFMYTVSGGPIISTGIDPDFCDIPISTSAVPWDGTVINAGGCQWVNTDSLFESWLGKSITPSGGNPPSIQLYQATSWLLNIPTIGVDSAIYLKTTGSTPAGVYTAYGDFANCANPQTLTVT